MFNIIILLQVQIKLSSVQLARKYMKRVASELDAMSEPEKEPNREFLVLQGVRFAFRVHQVYFTCHHHSSVDQLHFKFECCFQSNSN